MSPEQTNDGKDEATYSSTDFARAVLGGLVYAVAASAAASVIGRPALQIARLLIGDSFETPYFYIFFVIPIASAALFGALSAARGRTIYRSRKRAVLAGAWVAVGASIAMGAIAGIFLATDSYVKLAPEAFTLTTLGKMVGYSLYLAVMGAGFSLVTIPFTAPCAVAAALVLHVATRMSPELPNGEPEGDEPGEDALILRRPARPRVCREAISPVTERRPAAPARRSAA